MSAAIASNGFPSAPNIGSGTLKAHPTQSSSTIPLKLISKSRKFNKSRNKSKRLVLPVQISIPDFQVDLALPSTELKSEMESGEVILKASIDSDLTLVLTFTGELFREEDKFQIQQVDLNIETTTKLARSDFVFTSLRSVLSLAEHIYLRVPDLQLDLSLKFDEPLLDISQMLRRRQIAYRIMTIERSTGYEFQLPLDISGEQVKNITLIYNAIAHRSFVWPISEIGYGFLAIKGVLSRLLFLNQLSSITFGPHQITIPLFGKPISLGYGYITVEDKTIQNFDKIQEELAREDGHVVNVVVRSLSGQGRYDLPGAPRLPDEPWDEKLQSLIDLEDQLDAALIARYNALAASTLEGLSEDEKAEITARSDIGEAFLIEDSNEETI